MVASLRRNAMATWRFLTVMLAVLAVAAAVTGREDLPVFPPAPPLPHHGTSVAENTTPANSAMEVLLQSIEASSMMPSPVRRAADPARDGSLTQKLSADVSDEEVGTTPKTGMPSRRGIDSVKGSVSPSEAASEAETNRQNMNKMVVSNTAKKNAGILGALDHTATSLGASAAPASSQQPHGGKNDDLRDVASRAIQPPNQPKSSPPSPRAGAGDPPAALSGGASVRADRASEADTNSQHVNDKVASSRAQALGHNSGGDDSESGGAPSMNEFTSSQSSGPRQLTRRPPQHPAPQTSEDADESSSKAEPNAGDKLRPTSQDDPQLVEAKGKKAKAVGSALNRSKSLLGALAGSKEAEEVNKKIDDALNSLKSAEIQAKGSHSAGVSRSSSVFLESDVEKGDVTKKINSALAAKGLSGLSKSDDGVQDVSIGSTNSQQSSDDVELNAMVSSDADATSSAGSSQAPTKKKTNGKGASRGSSQGVVTPKSVDYSQDTDASAGNGPTASDSNAANGGAAAGGSSPDGTDVNDKISSAMAVNGIPSSARTSTGDSGATPSGVVTAKSIASSMGSDANDDNDSVSGDVSKRDDVKAHSAGSSVGSGGRGASGGSHGTGSEGKSGSKGQGSDGSKSSGANGKKQKKSSTASSSDDGGASSRSPGTKGSSVGSDDSGDGGASANGNTADDGSAKGIVTAKSIASSVGSDANDDNDSVSGDVSKRDDVKAHSAGSSVGSGGRGASGGSHGTGSEGKSGSKGQGSDASKSSDDQKKRKVAGSSSDSNDNDGSSGESMTKKNKNSRNASSKGSGNDSSSGTSVGASTKGQSNSDDSDGDASSGDVMKKINNALSANGMDSLKAKDASGSSAETSSSSSLSESSTSPDSSAGSSAGKALSGSKPSDLPKPQSSDVSAGSVADLKKQIAQAMSTSAEKKAKADKQSMSSPSEGTLALSTSPSSSATSTSASLNESSGAVGSDETSSGGSGSGASTASGSQSSPTSSDSSAKSVDISSPLDGLPKPGQESKGLDTPVGVKHPPSSNAGDLNKPSTGSGQSSSTTNDNGSISGDNAASGVGGAIKPSEPVNNKRQSSAAPSQETATTPPVATKDKGGSSNGKSTNGGGKGATSDDSYDDDSGTNADVSNEDNSSNSSGSGNDVSDEGQYKTLADDLAKELQVEKGQVEDLRHKLADADDDRKRLTKDLADEKRDKAKAEADAGALRAHLDRANNEESQLKDGIENLLRLDKREKAQLADADDDKAKLGQQIDDLKKQLGDEKKHSEDLKGAIEAKKKKDLEDQKRELEKGKNDLKAQQDKAKRDQEALDKQLHEVANVKDELGRKQKDLDKQKKDIDDLLAKQKAELEKQGKLEKANAESDAKRAKEELERERKAKEAALADQKLAESKAHDAEIASRPPLRGGSSDKPPAASVSGTSTSTQSSQEAAGIQVPEDGVYPDGVVVGEHFFPPGKYEGGKFYGAA